MQLGVNIDHVATLRNARGGVDPDLLFAALVCEKTGCHGITTHLREDRRHIKNEDVFILKKHLSCTLNLEMSASKEMEDFALFLKPNYACIVPENRLELTTEGGLDVINNFNRIKQLTSSLQKNNILVSLFIDPDFEQIKASKKTGACFIELHTGAYSNAFGKYNEDLEFQNLKSAAAFAQSLGLIVNAGHGLNYDNVSRLHDIFGLQELNIGHSIISKAIFSGLESAVSDMINLIS